MKLAISNLGWTYEEETSVAKLLRELGVKYIELAPTKTWADPTKASETEVKSYADFWRSYGLKVVAFQSVLYNRPDLKLFDSQANRRLTLDYLSAFEKLAGDMGAGVIVFGSPKNRQRGELAEAEALAVAKDFFSELARSASKYRTRLCIEPNAPAYGCDFITTAAEGIELVKSVAQDGFGLHLDTACMMLAGEDLAKSILKAGDLIRHFHVSAPQLEQVEDRADMDYRGAIAALKDINYQGFVSIEMRPDDTGTNFQRIESAVRFVQSLI